MMRTIPILGLVLLATSCSPRSAESAPATRVIRSMQIQEGATSHIGFESEYAKGSIAIEPGIHIDYTYTTTTSATGTTQRTLLTLDGKVLDFEGPELKLGEKSCGKLSGDVKIEIGPQGITVNGEKR